MAGSHELSFRLSFKRELAVFFSRRILGKYRLSDVLTGLLFISPYLVVLGIFSFYSAGYALYLSFHEYDLFSDPTWVGLENYAELLGDELFRKALKNTTLYVLGVVPTQTAVALFLAILLNRKIRGRAFFRAAWFSPCVISSVASSLIFQWLYLKQGVINYILSKFGLPSNTDWLGNPNTALIAIMLVVIWSTSAQFMVIFLAALQDVPASVYEAAEIDGANKRQEFLYVTLPLLRPTIFLVVVLGMIGAFQVFDQVYIMTEGGPLDSTLTVVYLIWKSAFVDFSMGYASAMSAFLFVIIFALTIIQRKFIDTSIQF